MTVIVGAFLGGAAMSVPVGKSGISLCINTTDRMNLDTASWTIMAPGKSYTASADASGRAYVEVDAGYTYTVTLTHEGLYENDSPQTVIAESRQVYGVLFDLFSFDLNQPGTGLVFGEDGVTLNHKNAVTAPADYVGSSTAIPRIKYDSEGHITATTTTATKSVSSISSISSFVSQVYNAPYGTIFYGDRIYGYESRTNGSDTISMEHFTLFCHGNGVGSGMGYVDQGRSGGDIRGAIAYFTSSSDSVDVYFVGRTVPDSGSGAPTSRSVEFASENGDNVDTWTLTNVKRVVYYI